MERCWKRGSDDWPVCCSPCLAVTFKPGISFRGSFSCQSFTLMGTHLLQSDVSFSGTLSWQPFWSSLICCNLASSSAVVSAAKRSHWQVLISSIGRLSRASASVSPLSQPFLLFLVCLCRRRVTHVLHSKNLGWIILSVIAEVSLAQGLQLYFR